MVYNIPNKKCVYCGCYKKGRHKLWCRSKEAQNIRNQIKNEI